MADLTGHILEEVELFKSHVPQKSCIVIPVGNRVETGNKRDAYYDSLRTDEILKKMKIVHHQGHVTACIGRVADRIRILAVYNEFVYSSRRNPHIFFWHCETGLRADFPVRRTQGTEVSDKGCMKQ